MPRINAILLTCFVALVVTGCRSSIRDDCISSKRLPFRIVEGKTTVLLKDRLSIDDILLANELSYHSGLSDILKSRFPNDQKLLTYLERWEPLHEKAYESGEELFQKIKLELIRNGGELYSYTSPSGADPAPGGSEKVPTEEGWLILRHGKIFKKYVVGHRVENEGK